MADTVTIACKLPNGLHLRLPGRPQVTIKGTAVPRGPGYADFIPPFMTPGGFALTSNVDMDFWIEWLKAYKDMEIVQNGIIFAMPKQGDVQARAKELGGVKTGLEPIDQDKMGPGLQRVGA